MSQEPKGPPDVAIVGLGRVGLSLAVACANAGLVTWGVDADPRRHRAILAGTADRDEPGVGDSLAAHIKAGRLCVSDRPVPAPAHVIAVGTDLDPETGALDLEPLKTAVRAVGDVIRTDDLVVLRSTMSLGTTRGLVVPMLEAKAPGVLVAACPERTIEGRALEEIATLPQIVGPMSAAAGARAEALFAQVAHSVVAVATPEAAEVAKLATNSIRDLHFAFANEIAILCEAAGVDMGEVVDATTHAYPRLGLARPGPVGGPCLSKDGHILSQSGQAYGVDLTLPRAARLANERLAATVVARLAARVAKPPAKVALLGLAFKGRPGTSDLRGSVAVPLANLVRAQWPAAEVALFDPEADPGAVEGQFGQAPCESWDVACAGADVVIVQTDHLMFGTLGLDPIQQVMAPGGVIYDLWSQFDHSAEGAGQCFVLGRGAPTSSP